MPNSMTGFGRASIDAPFGQLIVEIQSVNRKHFEISLQLPRELFRYENEIRKRIKEKVARGHLSLRIQLIPSAAAIGFPDLYLLKSVKEGWEKLAMDLKLDKAQVTLAFITQMMPHLEKKDFIDDDLPLQNAVSGALKNLLKMKEEEGKVLSQDILQRLKQIQKNVLEIENLTPNAAERMREKLSEKMNSLFTPDESLEDRLLREIALYAEKVDVTEEMIRLKSHFAQLEKCLKTNDAVGRKMEFVLQEISREVNTIGSKSLDANISHRIVEIKSELEKIREQIQNVE